MHCASIALAYKRTKINRFFSELEMDGGRTRWNHCQSLRSTKPAFGVA